MGDQKIRFSIADTTSDAAELARFFQSNLSDEYISHSELQGYRAIAPHKWSTNIVAVLETEIAARLGPPRDIFPPDLIWQGVILGRYGNDLAALALVTLSRRAVVPFGIIEDIVVDANLRGHGLGATTMNWIMDGFREVGLGRVFLESGLNNQSAHHLFERLGFKTVSIVMMQDL